MAHNRILKPGGIFIYITFGRRSIEPCATFVNKLMILNHAVEPHFRRRYLTRPSTTLSVTGETDRVLKILHLHD